jgi:prevent-host-death family protein
MKQVNIHAAKTNFSALIAAVNRGETIVIAKYGDPVAKLVPFVKKEKPPRVGFMEGAFSVPADFDTAFSDEIATAFYGDEK